MSIYPISKKVPSYKDLAKGDRIATFMFGWVTVLQKSHNSVMLKLDEAVNGTKVVRVSYPSLESHVKERRSQREVKRSRWMEDNEYFSALLAKYTRIAKARGCKRMHSDFKRLSGFRRWLEDHISVYDNCGWAEMLDSKTFVFVPDINNVNGIKPVEPVCSPLRCCIVPRELVSLFRFISKPICDVVYVFAGKVYIRYMEDGKDKRMYCRFVRGLEDEEDIRLILIYYLDILYTWFNAIETRYGEYPKIVDEVVRQTKDMLRGLRADDRNVLYDVRAV